MVTHSENFIIITGTGPMVSYLTLVHTMASIPKGKAEAKSLGVVASKGKWSHATVLFHVYPHSMKTPCLGRITAIWEQSQALLVGDSMSINQ